MAKYLAGLLALGLSGALFADGGSISEEAREFAKPPFRWYDPPMIQPLSHRLRFENISDDEVREIQRMMKPLSGKALLSIGGVVKGCNCEEGPSCTDQVWVMADRGHGAEGITFSRIDGHWGLGVLPLWILENQHLKDEFAVAGTDEERRKLAEAWIAHQKSFPMCSAHGTATLSHSPP